jgi:hypothetical protein
MPDNPDKPSLRAIYRQQRAVDRKAEQASPAHQALRVLSPIIFVVAAIAGAKHWIAASVSLIILAVCVLGLVALIIWSRHRRNSSGPSAGSS